MEGEQDAGAGAKCPQTSGFPSFMLKTQLGIAIQDLPA